MTKFNTTFRLALLATTLLAAAASTALEIPNTPLTATTSAKPMVMLVASKDHKLFYEAYNDAGDVDGDGTLDFRFKPSITYAGLFDSTVCYGHNNATDNSGLFRPSATATNGKCTSAWSGNWLNYVTTSRIDALRVALYGGHREVDSTTETILRRAYIPQDAHSWAKEYTSEETDRYKISDYTPLNQPDSGKRHLFGNLTANATTNCATLSNCSDDLPPLLSTVENTVVRVWEWASKERPVLDGSHGGARTDRTVRVTVCTSRFNKGCKQYPNNQYKPVGLLHEYGESDLMLFGLLTGSYDKNMSGGLLRKVVSSFKDEISTESGLFTSDAIIVKTFNNLRIRGYNNGRVDQVYEGGWLYNAAMAESTFPDWGNPIGEMVYESLRYFAGKGSATAAFTSAGTIDTEVGLTTQAWDDPYNTGVGAAKAPSCAKANILAISDSNPSFDSDQVPGSSFATVTGDLSGFNATTEANTITAGESGIVGSRFIGQSGATSDSAPTAKTITSLGNIRGLAPEEPTKQGSYYAAAAAYFGKHTDLRSTVAGTQTVDLFSVVLASPLPKIEPKLPNGKVIALVPFAKSIARGTIIDAAKNQFQPTNQIVDFYVETIANSGTADADSTINGGRYYAKFRVSFEDVEQGADHDMDAIAEYEISANDNTLSVKVKPVYQAGGARQNMGYIISGTTADGVHLVVQDENVSGSYYLNVPAGKVPGGCDVLTPDASCSLLPYPRGTGSYEKSDVTFTPGTSTASLLKGPLWYAAKWGGFIDKNGNGRPDDVAEWDADGDGVPDAYSEVQNPLKLKERLRRSLEDIVERSASASNVAANSTSLTSSTNVYQSIFNPARWSGNVLAYSVSSSGVGATPVWEAANALPAPADRKIFMRSSGTTKSLTWSGLTTAEQTTLGNEDTVNYLRGVRTQERQNGGVLRDRTTHVLGDVVHSSPYYVKDTNTLYVGANDGMLHAFNASNGAELFAFSPSEVISRLKNLASVGYSHDYYVDGDIVVTSQTQTPSKNHLYAALGRGGKGMFGLNVTSTSSFGAGSFLWEYTPTGSTDAAADTHLGYMLGRPQLARMNNGSLALIVGNGYNSTSGNAVLYIFVLKADGGISEIKKIDTGAGSDNGLTTPALVDTNGDGRVDVIYGGDLKGNVWKFDVSSTSAGSWAKALSGNALFVAKDSANKLQPITAGIVSVVNPATTGDHAGKRFVFFGTGRFITADDRTSTATQSWYGIIDDNAVVSNRSELTQRTIFATDTINGKPVRTFSAAVANDLNNKKGWYLDFTVAADAGERIVTTSNYLRLSESVLQSSSLIPVGSDPCIPGGRGYLNAVNPFTGAALTNALFDINRNNNFADDLLGTQFIGSVDLGVGIPGQAIQIGRRLVVGGSNGTLADVALNGGTAVRKGRILWREIVTD